jgi:hypothetical protein
MAPQEIDIAQSAEGNGAGNRPNASALADLSPRPCLGPQATLPLKIWTPRAPSWEDEQPAGDGQAARGETGMRLCS